MFSFSFSINNPFRSPSASAPPGPVKDPRQFFTDFSGNVPGPLVAPWYNIVNDMAVYLWKYETFNGVTTLRQSTTGLADTGAYTTGPGPATSAIEFYSEGETGVNNNSSLEWVIMPSTDMNTLPRYRIDYNPSNNQIRVRRGTPLGYTVTASFTTAEDLQVARRVCVLTQFDGTVVRVKLWNKDGVEPANWQIQWTDPTPITGPFYAGVHQYSARVPATVYLMGVGRDGAAAPRQ